MRVLVCGDRRWTDAGLLDATLDDVHADDGPITAVIEGEARGADLLARGWAEAARVPVEAFPADWDRYHRAAGPIRNRAMLDAKPDLVVAFHDDLSNSKGTADMVAIARKAGVPVRVVGHE